MAAQKRTVCSRPIFAFERLAAEGPGSSCQRTSPVHARYLNGSDKLRHATLKALVHEAVS